MCLFKVFNSTCINLQIAASGARCGKNRHIPHQHIVFASMLNAGATVLFIFSLPLTRVRHSAVVYHSWGCTNTRALESITHLRGNWLRCAERLVSLNHSSLCVSIPWAWTWQSALLLKSQLNWCSLHLARRTNVDFQLLKCSRLPNKMSLNHSSINPFHATHAVSDGFCRI